MRTVVHTKHAPAAIGPYSQAIRVAPFLYTAGQVGLHPETGKLVEGGVASEARQALENLKAVLEAAGGGLDQVVKTTVFLTTMEHFQAVNAVYKEFFAENPPARSAVAVHQLPAGALVEIEAVAYWS
jgi:2-iminobutanoate/2-iminopropanoate deaminase